MTWTAAPPPGDEEIGGITAAGFDIPEFRSHGDGMGDPVDFAQ
jgi:hypothetical protein